jgi:ribonuclease P protein component
MVREYEQLLIFPFFMKYRFPKSDRLKSSRDIARVFTKGRSDFVFPLQLRWLWMEESNKDPFEIKFTCVVPRKKIKKATQRNLFKRRMREAYRINKHLLLSGIGNKRGELYLVLIYQSDRDQSYSDIESALKRLFSRLEMSITKSR